VCKVAEGTGKEKEAFVSYDFKLRHKLGGSLRESATKLNSGRSVKLASVPASSEASTSLTPGLSAWTTVISARLRP